MARINVEEKWWTDIRRSALIRLLKDEERADGAAIRLWRAGFEYWKNDEASIPLEVFNLLPCAPELLKSGLAKIIPDNDPTDIQRKSNEGPRVYVNGSNEFFRWYKEGLAQRKVAGKSSAKRARDAKGRLLPSTNVQRESNGSPTEVQRKSNAVQPSSSSSSSSSVLREREQKNLSSEEVECIEAWGKTLDRYGIEKDARFDQTNILKLIDKYGLEQTKLALRGAGFEEKSADYDPAKHVSINRLLVNPKVFENFVNLGAQNKAHTREYADAELPC
jgi:hypothetical protein